jgi:hypothetical protein
MILLWDFMPWDPMPVVPAMPPEPWNGMLWDQMPWVDPWL